MNTQILSVETTVTSSSGREASSRQMGESGPGHTTGSRLSVSFSDIFAEGASFGEQLGEDLPGPLVPTADEKVEQSEPGETSDVNGVDEEAQMQGDVLPVSAVAIEADKSEVSAVDEASRKPPTAPSALIGVMISREPREEATQISMAFGGNASEPAVPAQNHTAASSGVAHSRQEQMDQSEALARPYLPTTRAIGEGDGEIAPNRDANGGGTADRKQPAHVPQAAIQPHNELRKVSQISDETIKAGWSANLSKPRTGQTLAKAETIFVRPSENEKPKTLVESRFSGLDIAPKSEVSKILNVQERSIASFGNLARIIQPSQGAGLSETGSKSPKVSLVSEIGVPALPESTGTFSAKDPEGLLRELPTTPQTSSTSTSLRADVSRMPFTQIAEQIVRNPDKSIDIALSPKELGHVRMHLATTDGTLTIIVTAERAETTELMRRHMDSLMQEFRRMGFDQAGFEFRQQGQGAQDREPPRDADTRLAELTVASESDTAKIQTSPRVSSASGLDMRI